MGTAYRWYILANQIVTKQDANSYTTEMAGLKYKVAHRRADKDTWSASDKAQRKRVVALLREMIAELEQPAEHAPGEPEVAAEAPKKRRAAPKTQRRAATPNGRAAA